jgi:hypothetical protein
VHAAAATLARNPDELTALSPVGADDPIIRSSSSAGAKITVQEGGPPTARFGHGPQTVGGTREETPSRRTVTGFLARCSSLASGCRNRAVVATKEILALGQTVQLPPREHHRLRASDPRPHLDVFIGEYEDLSP